MKSGSLIALLPLLVALAILGQGISDKLQPAITLLGNNPEHVSAVLILTISAWLLNFCGFVSRLLLLFGAALPLVLGLYGLVEGRHIPGPLDDWIAAAYQPLKKRISKEGVISTLKWSGVVCLIIGGSLAGSNTYLSPYGWIFLASSSGQYFVASVLMRDKQQIILFGVTFILVDSFGVYRWLIAD